MKRYLPLLWLSPLAVWAQSAPPAPPDAPPDSPPWANAVAAPPNTPMEPLRDKLKLRPDQLPFWNAFQSRIDAYVALYLRQKPPQAFANEAAPRQVAHLVDQLQNRLSALEDIEGALKDWYAHLDASQQETADQLILSTLPSFVSGLRPSEGGASEGRRERGGPGEGGPPRGGMGGGGMGGGMGEGF